MHVENVVISKATACTLYMTTSYYMIVHSVLTNTCVYTGQSWTGFESTYYTSK